ncbi:carcinoembryonic antigen-related cell adhesion molecule 5-like [Silurus meridionalis]|uniref:carcinoembryonic antigen-related cell adhesion molecule 5-like n=1 Tax=Silurus meridionalis TaxID=175797 RepID=UPI001EECDAAA|nr:carcinoembryonic antigen-related cell adhesion molecule 5-like [Silurus meridionalis]
MKLSPLPVMLLSLIPVAHVQGSAKAVLSIKPDTLVFSGEHVTLSCDVQGGAGAQTTYSWYKNNTKLIKIGRDLLITGIGYSDNGSYTCRGNYSELSNAVVVIVSDKPKPTMRVNPQSSVYTGDTVTLSCELQHMTGWEFKWYKNKQYLQHLNTKHESTNILHVTDNNAGETVYECIGNRSNTLARTLYYTEHSDQVRIIFKERPSVLSVSPQNWLTEGDSVTLSCEVTNSSTDWTFSLYTVVPFRDGVTQINNTHNSIMYVELLSDSSRGSGGSYTLSPSALHHTGVYVCRGERGEPVRYTLYSNPQPVWISGESPPVSLIISPSRTQHFNAGLNDVMYAEIQLKPMEQEKRTQGRAK